MRLRENAVHLKLSTYADVLDSGGHLAFVSELEAATGGTLTRFRDLSGPRLPEYAMEERGRAMLSAHEGAGFHQTARFRLSADDGPLRSLELTAGLHPYSGVYTTQFDVRIDASWADRNAETLVEMLTWCVARFEPLTAQVHDVDDDAMQNIDNPRLLELGYGVTGSTALEDRPGREAVRGQFRLCIAWLTYFGAEALDLLERPDTSHLDGTVTMHIGRGRLWRLSDIPSDAFTPEFRSRQRALRETLGIDALIERDRRAHGYWKRKK